MADKEWIDALIAKLEASAEGSRELDAEIAVWRMKQEGGDCWVDSDPGFVRIPGCGSVSSTSVRARHYTTSIDAALSLVPAGWEWLKKAPRAMSVYRLPPPDQWANHIDGGPAPDPIALCIAALKARKEVSHDYKVGTDGPKPGLPAAQRFAPFKDVLDATKSDFHELTVQRFVLLLGLANMHVAHDAPQAAIPASVAPSLNPSPDLIDANRRLREAQELLKDIRAFGLADECGEAVLNERIDAAIGDT